jgi:PEGA domain
MIEDVMRHRSTRPVLVWALAWAAELLSTPAVHGASPPIDRGESTTTTGTIEVQSSPGARVSIDGASGGEVPVVVRVPAGEHRIEVAAPGHHPWRATIEVRASTQVSVKTDLVAISTVEEPVDPGVFLSTEKEHGLLTSRGPTADASALLTARRPTTQASELRPRRPTTGTNQAEVFLPTLERSVLLPNTPPSDRAERGDVFLLEPRADQGTGLLPVGGRSGADEGAS